MELDATKYELIQWIISLNDLRLIEQLSLLQRSEQESNGDFWNALTSTQQEGILEAKKSLGNGEGRSWQEVREGIKAEFGF